MPSTDESVKAPLRRSGPLRGGFMPALTDSPLQAASGYARKGRPPFLALLHLFSITDRPAIDGPALAVNFAGRPGSISAETTCAARSESRKVRPAP